MHVVIDARYISRHQSGVGHYTQRLVGGLAAIDPSNRYTCLVERNGPGLPVPTRGSWVEYVITSSGAEPAARPLAPLDYQHYVDRQLAPVADGILGFVGSSFSALTDKQIGLF